MWPRSRHSLAMATKRKRPVKRKPVKRKPGGGRKPSTPLAVIYRGDATSYVMLAHPLRDETKTASVKGGHHAALGVLRDEGYAFGPVRSAVPRWVAAKVADKYTVIGVASITATPFL